MFNFSNKNNKNNNFNFICLIYKKIINFIKPGFNILEINQNSSFLLNNFLKFQNIFYLKIVNKNIDFLNCISNNVSVIQNNYTLDIFNFKKNFFDISLLFMIYDNEYDFNKLLKKILYCSKDVIIIINNLFYWKNIIKLLFNLNLLYKNKNINIYNIIDLSKKFKFNIIEKIFLYKNKYNFIFNFFMNNIIILRVSKINLKHNN